MISYPLWVDSDLQPDSLDFIEICPKILDVEQWMKVKNFSYNLQFELGLDFRVHNSTIVIVFFVSPKLFAKDLVGLEQHKIGS